LKDENAILFHFPNFGTYRGWNKEWNKEWNRGWLQGRFAKLKAEKNYLDHRAN
jgi:hypothetical protein